jgi:hypothetical protein
MSHSRGGDGAISTGDGDSVGSPVAAATKRAILANAAAGDIGAWPAQPCTSQGSQA